MAYVTNFTCSNCGKEMFAVCSGERPLCLECQTLKRDQDRRQYFSGLKGLTVEERLEKIEEWIYDHRNIQINIPRC